MAGPVPHVLSFGGGIVREGSPDTQRTDEVRSADGYDIGPRGSLIAARDVSDYIAIRDRGAAPAAWAKLHGIHSFAGNNFAKQVAVGEGLDTATLRYLLAAFARSGETDPVSGASANYVFGAPEEDGVAGSIPSPRSEGVIVTYAPFPGVYAVTNPAAKVNVLLVNIGAREGFAANVAPGLYALLCEPPNAGTTFTLLAISKLDALGTGPRGEFSGGSSSNQLYFRGIGSFGPHAIGWGFDSADSVGKEGPARLMFANLNNPLKWGHDNQAAAGGNRSFSDSDAIPIGDGGEIIRAGLSWNGRFWIGSDRQLHWLGGLGRDSFITDGANAVAKAENVLGAHCLVEGPDHLLYGVGDQGMWAYDGGSFERHHKRLRDFANNSLGYWDLIWLDRSRADTYPGKTNADLVWMVSDWDNEQVVIGIPWCDAASGRGFGTDTVLIKFNVRGGGFTRQVFSGVVYTAADYVRRQRQTGSSRFLGTATAGEKTIRKYGDYASADGYLSDPKPSTEIGPYALYGPNGAGVYRKGYLTLAWESDVGTAEIDSLSAETDETITVNAIVAGTPVGSEVIEVWSYNEVDDAWALETSAAWGGQSEQSVVVSGLRVGMEHVLAVRLSRAGNVHTSYSDADPDNWPAAARATTETTLTEAPTLAITTWNPATGAVLAQLSGDVYLQSHVEFELEYQPEGGGAWTAMATTTDNVAGTASATDAALIGTYPAFRVRQVTGYAQSPYSNEIDTDIDVAEPTAVTIVDLATGPGTYTCLWTPGEAGVTTLVSCETTGAGVFGAETETAIDAEDGQCTGVCPTAHTPLKGRVRHKKVMFGTNYFSDFVESSNAVAENCP